MGLYRERRWRDLQQNWNWKAHCTFCLRCWTQHPWQQLSLLSLISELVTARHLSICIEIGRSTPAGDMAEPSAEPGVVATVPCAPGGRLHVSWGLGNELYTLDLQPAGASSAESTASCVQW